jgi:hypothetical protein
MTQRASRIFVIENEPPPTSPRWYCAGTPGFDTPEDAVAWALSQGHSAIVQTLAGTSYWAGEEPSDWGGEGHDARLRSWPPAAAERKRMDARYEAAVAAARDDARARDAYERERTGWLRAHAPEFVDRAPYHECLVLVPGDDETSIEFEELAPDGTVCGARRTYGGPRAFGDPDVVLAEVAERTPDDPWVTAVCAALRREVAWAHRGRRSALFVVQGTGEMFHVSPASNRESIRRYGLDWVRMGATPGIAGSRQPELEGIFLCANRQDADFFIEMGSTASDIWAVDVSGAWLEGDPGAGGGGAGNWLILPEPVEPSRVRLINSNVLSSLQTGGRID